LTDVTTIERNLQVKTVKQTLYVQSLKRQKSLLQFISDNLPSLFFPLKVNISMGMFTITTKTELNLLEAVNTVVGES
jgi:hypothetical protein